MSRPRSLLLLLALTLLALVVGRALSDRGRGRALAPSSSQGALFAPLSRIAQAPNDAASWLLLGEHAQREGNLPLARAAFRAALELSPRDGNAHARLGFVLYEEGRDKDALLELAAAQRAGADKELLEFTLSMMRAHVDLAGPFPRFSAADAEPEDDEAEAGGHAPATDPRAREEREPASDAQEREPPPPPSEATPLDEEGADDDEEADEEEPGPEPEAALAPAKESGVCELPLQRRGESGIFVVDVLVNGVEARLIVDTGASLTVLSRQLVESSGLGLSEDGFLTVRTAAGQRRFSTAEVREVEVGGRIVEGVRVAICEECGAPGSDGLLGLDVQEPLGISMSASRGTLRFADCEPH